jgi:type IV pilus assembly protein PilA
MKEKGFSLIELLIVVIIIAAVAAIAIPSLLASRRAANEASAIASIRTIHSAQGTYFSVVGGNASFGDLSDLGSAGYLDSILGAADTVTKSGYEFTVTRNATAPFGLYCATGQAMTFGTGGTGTRDFAVDRSGVIQATYIEDDISCSGGQMTVTSGGPIE